MLLFRAFLRDHRRLATCVVALALALKLLVPAGYMLAAKAHVLTVEVCADNQGQRLVRQIVIPSEDTAGAHAKTDVTCGWSALGMAALGGTDAPLLALALAFILLLGLAPQQPAPRSEPVHLRPPPRGPPSPLIA